MAKQIYNSIFVFVLGFLLGVLAFSIVKYYYCIKPTFFSFNIVDLLSLIIYSLIAIYVAFYLQNKHSDLQIKKNLFLSIVADISRIFEDDISFIYTFMKNKPDDRTDIDKIRVTLTLKKINNKIYLLQKHTTTFKENITKLVEEIDNTYKEIRNITTGEEEFIKSNNFSDANINSFLKHSNNIIFKLDQIKLSIFS